MVLISTCRAFVRSTVFQYVAVFNTETLTTFKDRFHLYTALHMAVLANKPEMLIELLTKTQANYLIEDGQGRTLLDLVYAYNPSYVESF